MNVRRRATSDSDAARPDYTALGEQLLAKLGIDASGSGGRHDRMNAIYKCAENGATIFVGNNTAAKGPASELTSRGITHVVNCTTDLKNHCAHEGKQQYYRFNIAHWSSAGASDYRERTNEEVVAHIDRALTWVDSALAGGGNVLIHCLAGAHRAGTTGILCLMHKADLSAAQATAAAQALRPIIDPIYDFEDCLRMYEVARNARKASATDHSC